MTRTISDTDIAALVAVRSVIADAAHHPGRQAAIEAIDRLSAEPDESNDALLERLFGIKPRAPGCPDCEKRKQADDRFMQHMLAPSGHAIDAPSFHEAAEKLRVELSLPPQHDVIEEFHIGSGTPRSTQAGQSDPIKRWQCSDCGDAAVSTPADLRYPCGRCGGWMTRTWANPKCHVCGGRLRWESAVDMNLICNGGVRTVTTCGSDDCRRAVMRTSRPSDKPRLLAKRGDAVRHPKHGWYAIVQGVDGDALWLSISGVPGVQRELASDVEVIARDAHPPDERVEVGSLYAVKWTKPDGTSGLGAERASRGYLERSHHEIPRQEGWTYEIVPAPDGDKEWRFERDYVPAAWIYEASALIRDAVHRADHGVCGETCWKCKAERFLESL